MFKTLEKIKDFGVFQDYTNTNSLEDFAEKNIIYGWNYSGKTTISRMFSCIEHKTKHGDYPVADFSIKDVSGNQWRPINLNSCPKIVRVFNSDFIAHNLSWNGELFNPILLLGEESIEAQNKIEENNDKIKRCEGGALKKQNLITKTETEIKNLKTKKSKQVKNELEITEAFDSRHLDNLIRVVKGEPEKYIVSDMKKFHLLKSEALASDSDKLPILDSISINSQLNEIEKKIKEVLEVIPEFSETIDYLKDNPEIANWVDKGLSLHDQKNECEFCGNLIPPERFLLLRAHFSEDLRRHKKDVEDLKLKISECVIGPTSLHERDLYENLREKYGELKKNLDKSIKNHNREIKRIEKLLSDKYNNPFKKVKDFKADSQYEKETTNTLEEVNELIGKNNKITNEFKENKARSFEALKRHYAAEFMLESNIEKNEKAISLLQSHIARYQKAKKKFIESNKSLEATISKAQNGREKINELITRFLGREEISIEVVKEITEERFRLTRSGKIAKNLSEGEKTAISFSFFLTKLLELPKLEDAVVYIDDPISSLDSNHVFQINSILKNNFFFQEGGSGGEWKLRCKQLFVSTHNFEFFSLLKELPLNKNKSRFYLVKRIEPSKSTICNLPESIKNYSSEYHYLFSIIYKFHNLPDKSDLETLLAIPNALRRFLEIYTYAKMPTFTKATVDQRADKIFGLEESKRILKVLHYFSHLNNIDRLVNNSDLISDIENVVDDVMAHLQKDTMHYDALLESVI